MQEDNETMHDCFNPVPYGEPGLLLMQFSTGARTSADAIIAFKLPLILHRRFTTIDHAILYSKG